MVRMGKRTQEDALRLVFPDKQRFRWWLHLVDLLDKAEDMTGVIVPCKNAPDLFYPEMGGPHGTGAYARQACNRCPIQDACGTYAIIANEYDGIWGGMSEIERKNLRKEIIQNGKQAFFVKNGYFAYRKDRLKTDTNITEQFPWEAPFSDTI